MARLAGKGRVYTMCILDHKGNPTDYTYEFPSVTSILDAVVAKPKLMHWYYSSALQGMGELIGKYGGKLPQDFTSLKQLMAQEGHSPYSKRDSAASRGNDIHADLEALAKGETIVGTAENRALVNWWRDKGLTPADVLETEVPLVSFKYRYAGTVDLIYRDPATGKIHLCDLKTGKHIQWTYFVQGEAYRQAYVEAGGHVDEVTVLHTPPMPSDPIVSAAQQAEGSSPVRGWTEKVARDIDFSCFEAILNIYNWLPADWMPDDLDGTALV